MTEKIQSIFQFSGHWIFFSQGKSMKKVLVVDDSKTIRTLCEWLYKGLEDRILTAESAFAARKIIQSESPDVVIVDYTLPDMDPYAFIASIKDQAHVIMLGGNYVPFDPEKAIASGAVGTLMKPFLSTDFFAAVEDAMNAVAAEPEAFAEPEPVELPPAPDMRSGDMPSMFSAPLPTAVEPAAPIAPAFAEPMSLSEPVAAFHSSSASSVPPIGGFVAPISASVAPGQAKPNSPISPAGTNPFAGAKRFNFPGSSPAPAEPAFSQPADFGASNPLHQPDSITSETTVVGPAPQRTESLTPRSPISSVSPAVQAPREESKPAIVAPTAPAPAPADVQIDPAVLRAEVISAVKSLLPAIVNSYLKKLIQAEVKPQLQNWVDARVEALVKKMMEQK